MNRCGPITCARVLFRFGYMWILLFITGLSHLAAVTHGAESFRDFVIEDQKAFQAWMGKGKTATDDRTAPVVARVAGERTDSKTVKYEGRAEADGRSAILQLDFDGGKVSGHLVAKGVSQPGIRLTTTDISFRPVPLTGAWEDPNTTIVAPWVGGDYMDGALVTSYPTNGTLTIKLAEREGNRVVHLHRVAGSSYGYVFGLQGVVYSVGTGTTSSAVADGAVVSTGYWDPVGTWSGTWQPPGEALDKTVSYEAVFTKDGAVKVTIRGVATDDRLTLRGQWRRQGMGLAIEWSAPDLANADITDTSTVLAGFDGPNCLVLRTEDGSIKLFRKTPVSGGDSTSAPPSIDVSKVIRIELARTNLTVLAETNTPAPAVFVVLRGSGERQPLPPNVRGEWTGLRDISVDDNGKIIVGPRAKPGDAADIRVQVTIGGRPFFAKCRVTVGGDDVKLGSIRGYVRVGFWPEQLPPCATDGGVILLTGPGGVQRYAFGADGEFSFGNLQPGGYRLRLERVALPATVPGGFVPNTVENVEGKEIGIPNLSPEIGGNWDARTVIYWYLTKKPEPKDYCVFGKVTYKGEPVPRAAVTLINHDGSSRKDTTTDEHGYYSMNTQGMVGGQHLLMVEKMVDINNVPPWATDDDLLDIASYTGAKTPLSVVLPILVLGEEIDIPCLTRKELLGTPGAAPTPTNSVSTPIVPR